MEGRYFTMVNMEGNQDLAIGMLGQLRNHGDTKFCKKISYRILNKRNDVYENGREGTRMRLIGKAVHG